MKTVRRRRLEGKTDYKSRLGLLKADIPRLVIRKTNRYIIVQLISSTDAQDKVVLGVTSKVLLSKGWPKEKFGSLKSLAASYLTGYHVGNLLAKKKIKNAIFDIGMNRNVHKSRIYAVLKGLIDAGMEIPTNKEILPTIDEINKNKNLTSIFDKVKEKI